MIIGQNTPGSLKYTLRLRGEYKKKGISHICFCDDEIALCPFCGAQLVQYRNPICVAEDKYVYLNGAVCKICNSFFLESTKETNAFVSKYGGSLVTDKSLLHTVQNQKIINEQGKTKEETKSPQIVDAVSDETSSTSDKKTTDSTSVPRQNNRNNITVYRRLRLDSDRQFQCRFISLISDDAERCTICGKTLDHIELFIPYRTRTGKTSKHGIAVKGQYCQKCKRFHAKYSRRLFSELQHTQYRYLIDYSHLNDKDMGDILGVPSGKLRRAEDPIKRKNPDAIANRKNNKIAKNYNVERYHTRSARERYPDGKCDYCKLLKNETCGGSWEICDNYEPIILTATHDPTLYQKQRRTLFIPDSETGVSSIEKEGLIPYDSAVRIGKNKQKNKTKKKNSKSKKSGKQTKR